MTSPHVLDVIGGNAGAIPALLALSRDGRRPVARRVAEQLGEELLDTAIRQGSSLDVGGRRGRPGQKSALSRSPDSPMATAASDTSLFAHLRGHRTARLPGRGTGGIRCMRMACSMRRRGTGLISVQFGPATAPTRPFSVAWCHGAPGIALARMRAAILAPESARCAPGRRPDRPGHHADGARRHAHASPSRRHPLPRGGGRCRRSSGPAASGSATRHWPRPPGPRGDALIDKYAATGSWPSGSGDRRPESIS